MTSPRSAGTTRSRRTNDAITAALTNHFTRAEATANLVAGITECKDYTDTSLLDYSDTAQMNQAIADALVPFGTIVQRDAAIAAALAAYYTSAQTDSAIAAGLATIDLSPYWTIAQVQAAITAALVPVTLSNGQSWTGGPTFNLLKRHQRPEEPLRGGSPHGHLPEPRRHHPHRIGQHTPAARPTRSSRREPPSRRPSMR